MNRVAVASRLRKKLPVSILGHQHSKNEHSLPELTPGTEQEKGYSNPVSPFLPQEFSKNFLDMKEKKS
jgi:hypothetical protein